MEFWIKLLMVSFALGVLMYLVQRKLCGAQIPLTTKLLPTALLLVGGTICVGICWYLNDKEQTLIFVLVFLLGLVLLSMLIGTAAAWGVHLIVRNAQKRK